MPLGLSVMQSRANQNVHTAKSSKRKRLGEMGKMGSNVHHNADLKIEDGEESLIQPNFSHSKLPNSSQGKRRIEARI